MKKKYLVLLFLINTMLLNAEIKNVSTAREFVEALKTSNKDDEIVLSNDISMTTGSDVTYTHNDSVVNNASSLYFNGATINGNGHSLGVLGWNFSLKNSTKFKNINLDLYTVNSTSKNEDAKDLKKSSIIFANGYDLTFENVTTNETTGNTAGKNNKPVIIMGTAKIPLEGTQDADLSNTLTITGDKEIKFKTIIAGSETGSKEGKTTLNISSNTKITNNTGTVFLRSLDGSQPVNVELNTNGNSTVKTFDAENNENGNITININNGVYNETNGITEFKGKIDELNLSGNTKIYLEKNLNVGNLNLKEGTPYIKVLKADMQADDDYIVLGKEGSINVTNLTSENPNAKIEISDNRANKDGNVITAENVTGKFVFTTNGERNTGFPNYNDANDPNHTDTPTPPAPNNELEEAKNRVKQELQLKENNLTSVQIQTLKEQIEGAANQEELNGISTKITTLSSVMEEITREKNALEQKKREANYNSISETVKNEVESIITRYTEAINNIETEVLNTILSEIKAEVPKVELEFKKVEAKEAIDSFQELKQEQKTAFKSKIDEANNDSVIEEVKTKAERFNTEYMPQLKSVKEELSNLKNDAEYANIGNTEVDSIISEIDAFTSIEENSAMTLSNKATQESNKVKGKIEVEKSKTPAKTEIENLTSLEEAQKTALKNEITNATTNESILEVKAKATELDTAMQALKAKVKEIEGLKTDNLSDSLKAEIDTELNKKTQAYSSTEKSVVEAAIQTLTASKTSLENKIREEQNLSALKARVIEELKTSATTVDSTEYETRINQANDANAVNAIKDEITNRHTQNVLNTKKQEAKTELDGLTYLYNDEKQNFLTRIDQAQDAGNIDSIKQEATQKNQTNKTKEDEAKAYIDTLTYLSRTDSLYGGTSLEAKAQDYKNRIENAQSDTDIDNIKNEANTENESRKLQIEKSEAKKHIDTLSNLSNERKEAFRNEIDTANSEQAINSIKERANTENTSTLETKKQEIKAYLETLEFLSETNKNEIIGKINTADDIASLEKIKTESNEKEAQDKQTAIETYKNSLNTLTDLKPKQVESLKNVNINSKAELENSYTKASNLNSSMKSLKEANDSMLQLESQTNKEGFNEEYKTTLNSLKAEYASFEGIEESEVNALTEKINSHKSKLQDEIDRLTDLDDKKNKAKEEIRALTEISETEISNFEREIDTKTDSTGIDEVKSRAIDRNTKKKELKDSIDSKVELNTAQKTDLKEKVKQEQNDLTTIQNNVEELVNAMTELETARTTLSNLENTRSEEYAKLADDKKQKVTELLTATEKEALGNLNKTAVDSKKSEIEALTTETNSELDKILEANRALIAKQKEINAHLETLKFITDEHKKEISDKVNSATEISSLENIITEANEKDKQDEQQAKTDAKAQKSNSNLEEYQNTDADSKIDAADSKEAISKVLESISELNTVMPELKTAKEALQNLNNLDKLVDRTEIDNLLNQQVYTATEATALTEKLKNKKDEVEKEIERIIQEEQNFEEVKQNALNELTNNTPFLEDSIRESYKSQINLIVDRTKSEDIKVILRKALAENDLKKKEIEASISKENLTSEQINSFKERLNVNNITKNEIDNIVRESEELNTSMGELKTEKEKLLELIKNPYYNRLDQALKTEVSEILAKDNTYANISTKDMVDTLKTEIETEIQKIKDEINKLKDEDDKLKEKSKEHISNLQNLEQSQKDEINSKIDTVKDVEELNTVIDNAEKLNEVMGDIKVLRDEIEDFKANNVGYQKFVESDKEKVENILNNLLTANETISNTKAKEILEKANKEFEVLKNIAESIKDKEIANLEKYKKYLDVFQYDNVDIIRSFDRPLYFNFNLGKNVSDFKDLITELNVGFNHKLNDKVSIGAFAGYDKDISRHFYVGINAKTDNILGFIRYRLAKYDNLINHNIELYTKYNKEFKINDNFSITPSAGLFAGYSSKVNIDENVRLNPKYIILMDLETKFNYSKNGFNVYLIPNLKFGYNITTLQDINYINNILVKNNSYINYYILTGVSKNFNNLKLDINFKLSGDEKGLLKFKTNLGIGYYF